jgi:hypothetical protein
MRIRLKSPMLTQSETAPKMNARRNAPPVT